MLDDIKDLLIVFILVIMVLSLWGFFKCLYFLGRNTKAFTVEMSGKCFYLGWIYLGKINEKRLVKC